MARYLNFSRAAEELCISQPGVTFHIHALEDEYGCPLVERVGKRLYLTDAGVTLAAYVARAATVEAEARTAMLDARGLESGRLVIGASATIGIYLLPEVVGEFRHRYAGVKVSLRIGNKRHTIERLLRNELDFASVAGPVSDSSIIAERYLDDELVAIVAPSHRFAQAVAVGPDDLHGETFLVRESGSGTQELMETGLADLGVTPAETMELGSTEAVKQAVAANLGISTASRYSVEAELETGRLCTANIPSLRMTRTLLLLHHRNKRLSRAAVAFREVLREVAGHQVQRAGPGTEPA